MVRRDRHDITAEILRKATSGRRKTELMSDVGLSSLQMKQYLDTLLDKGLLEFDNKQQQLKTTKEGLEFLGRCSECLLFPWEKQKRKPEKKT
jgi:predicted transcriptional regulator